MAHFTPSQNPFKCLNKFTPSILTKWAVLAILAGIWFGSAFGSPVYAQNSPLEHYQRRPDPHFEPNQGQVVSHAGDKLNNLLYVYEAPGMKMGLTKNGFSYNLYTSEKASSSSRGPEEEKTDRPSSGPSSNGGPKKVNFQYHRVEVAFLGANEDPEIIAENKTNFYTNHYLCNRSDGVTHVYGYQKLTYKNLYPNIDLVLRSRPNEKGRAPLKYDIVVHPGGDLSQVKMAYKGMDNLTLEGGELEITTSLGRITETIPASYWAKQREAAHVHYRLQGDQITFEAKKQREGQTLVIDPGLTWSTYLGGNNIELANGVAVDSNRDVLVAGNADNHFPTTTGAYQTSFSGGGGDAFVSKFDNAGNLQWSTYLGGGKYDFAEDIATDGAGNAYVTGATEGNFPVTSGAYQSSYGGGPYDAFLSKLGSGGSLEWSTYMGGANDDQGRALATDKAGDPFITGKGESGFPTSTGAYQTTHGGRGLYDAWVAKLDSSGSRQWSTYLGGDQTDRGEGLAIDSGGQAWVTGVTRGNFPITRGAQQASFGGSLDAFICQIKSDGSLQWSTYHGGNYSDEGLGVATDGQGNAFVTGEASQNFPTTKGAYQTTFGGSIQDAFLSKWSNSGTLQWSTYLGGGSTDGGYGVATDLNGNAFVMGRASSSFPTTNNAYQSQNRGSFDAFFSKWSTTGTLQWSTFFGGNNRDEGEGLATDGQGNAFFTGVAEATFPTTSNAYQDSIGGVKDAFLSKFTPCDTLLKGNFKGDFLTDTVCQGKPLDFKDNSTLDSGAITQYHWHFGDGDTANGANVKHRYASPGEYDVILEMNFENGCLDTITKTSKVHPAPSADFILKDTGQCVDGNTFQFQNRSSVSKGKLTYYWEFGDGDTATTVSPGHTYDSFGQYQADLVATSDKGCRDTTSAIVRVHPVPEADFAINDTSQCLEGNNFRFTNQSALDSGGMRYYWEFGDGDTATTVSPGHTYDSFGQYQPRLVVTSNKGCRDSTAGIVRVHPVPEAGFTINDTSQCLEGNNFRFTNQSALDSGGMRYQWYFGDGDTAGSVSPGHTYDSFGQYQADLVATSDKGCRDTTSAIVRVHPVPEADFTINDTSQCLEGNNFRFTSQSSVDTGALSYQWHFGDGDTASRQVSAHEYMDTGNFRVGLRIISDKGCRDTARQAVMVNPMPISQFQYRRVDQETIAFQPEDTTLRRYQWDFGDGAESQAIQPTHVYDSSGAYPVTLAVTNAYACRTTFMDTLTMNIVAIGSRADNPSLLKAYPNPFQDELTIRTGALQKGHIEVLNMQGQSMVRQNLPNPKLTLKTGDWQPGTYLIRLVGANGTLKTRKMIKFH